MKNISFHRLGTQVSIGVSLEWIIAQGDHLVFFFFFFLSSTSRVRSLFWRSLLSELRRVGWGTFWPHPPPPQAQDIQKTQAEIGFSYTYH